MVGLYKGMDKAKGTARAVAANIRILLCRERSAHTPHHSHHTSRTRDATFICMAVLGFSLFAFRSPCERKRGAFRFGGNRA